MDTKLVVLGIPWDVDTDGLRQYMSKFGELKDVIVMQERSTGRSRGFGYVTFSSADDAKNALASEHMLGNRVLEVKVATPKEEMKPSSKRITRIFVARIPQSVTEGTFRGYFETYGEIVDLYMPKDKGSKGHRGIGFITFENADAVDTLMAETHELGGSTIVVDRATPKDEDIRPPARVSQGGYGAYNAYITAATRYAALGAPTLYDHPSSAYGRGVPEPARGMSKKIFVGRLPQEANAEDLRLYFGKFGRILDVYVPKDPKRTGHRGFGFVTFAEDGVAERVSRRTHEIHGQQIRRSRRELPENFWSDLPHAIVVVIPPMLLVFVVEGEDEDVREEVCCRHLRNFPAVLPDLLPPSSPLSFLLLLFVFSSFYS